MGDPRITAEDHLATWLSIDANARDAAQSECGACETGEDENRPEDVQSIYDCLLTLDLACNRILGVRSPGIEHDGKAVDRVCGAGSSGEGSSRSAICPDRHESEPSREAPPRLGRFQIRGELGRGAHGCVYHAFDPLLGREVSLKIPRPETLISRELRRRFLREAEAVARLNHPHLVPVHEVGSSGPVCYIASAYCNGQSLSAWLKQQAEPVPEMVAARLVAVLAETLHYVHGQGILHRDVKPANVLLEPQPHGAESGRPPNGQLPFTPRLTDFGLAKFVGEPTGQTQSGSIIGTPAYMAPEQARGQLRDVGPAADTYALGAVLYELLAGHPPFQGQTELEIVRHVIDGKLVSPRRLRPGLSLDLTAICQKSLEYDPNRRYTTAGALAEDLNRFLSGEPVRARRAGTLARLGKWARRKPAMAGLVFLLLCTGVAGFMAVTWQWRRSERLRRESETHRVAAEENFRQAHRAVREFHSILLDRDTYDAPVFQRLRRELLETARKYYDSFLRDRASDESLTADLADTYYHLAHIQHASGSKRDALRLYQDSLPLWTKLARDNSNVRDYSYFLAKTLERMGLVHHHERRFRRAESFYRQALAIRQALVEQQPDNYAFERELACSHHCLGSLNNWKGHYQDAIEHLEKSREIRDRLLDLRPDDADVCLRTANTYYEIGVAHFYLNDLQMVPRYLARALQLQKELVARKQRRSESTKDMAITLQLLGRSNARSGNVRKAIENLQQAELVLKGLIASQPANASYPVALAENEQYLVELLTSPKNGHQPLQLHHGADAGELLDR